MIIGVRDTIFQMVQGFINYIVLFCFLPRYFWGTVLLLIISLDTKISIYTDDIIIYSCLISKSDQFDMVTFVADL